MRKMNSKNMKEQIGTFAAVKTEGHFFQVSRKMLCADFVPRSHDATLEQRECALDSARVRVTINIDVGGMIDCLVLTSMNASGNHCFWIGREVEDRDSGIEENYSSVGSLSAKPSSCLLQSSSSTKAADWRQPGFTLTNSSR